jgi:hypothetical protein
VWRFIDGRRTVRAVAEQVAEARGEDVASVSGGVEQFCQHLATLGLLERA